MVSKNRTICHALGTSVLSQATRDIFHRKSLAVDLDKQTERNFKTKVLPTEKALGRVLRVKH